MKEKKTNKKKRKKLKNNNIIRNKNICEESTKIISHIHMDAFKKKSFFYIPKYSFSFIRYSTTKKDKLNKKKTLFLSFFFKFIIKINTIE